MQFTYTKKLGDIRNVFLSPNENNKSKTPVTVCVSVDLINISLAHLGGSFSGYEKYDKVGKYLTGPTNEQQKIVFHYKTEIESIPFFVYGNTCGV